MSLWRLEWLRLWRTRRWITLGTVFLVLGFGNPLATRYLGELLQGATGGGTYIEIIVREPRAADGMASYFGNITSLGTLVAVVVAGLAFSVRANPALASLYLTQVRSPVALLTPRVVVAGLAAAAAALLGGAAATLQTTLLFGAPAPGSTVAGVAASCLAMVFAVAVTFLCATLLRSQVGTIAVALGIVFVAVPSADLIPGVSRVGPNAFVNLPTTLQYSTWSANATWATLVTLVLTAVSIAVGMRRATRWEV